MFDTKLGYECVLNLFNKIYAVTLIFLLIFCFLKLIFSLLPYSCK